MNLRLWTTSLLAVLAVAGPSVADDVTRFAVIAGNNLGLPRSEPLRYAMDDAHRMAHLLEELGGVRRSNMDVLTDRGPQALRQSLDRMADRISALEHDAVFIFYYSGHADSGWLRMGGRGMPLVELRRRLETMPAKIRIAIVDACQSGEITRAKGGKVVSPFLEERPVNVEGLVILTSASAAENAQESEVLGSSFFSHHLMSGLRGPADKSADGRVSVLEAYDYAYHHTVRETEKTVRGTQHPMFLYALEGEGDVALTVIETTRARVELADDVDGTVIVFSLGGRIEAEVAKTPGRPVIIALAPGRYSIKRRTADRLWNADVVVRDGETISLEAASFVEMPLVAARDKGVVPMTSTPLRSARVQPLTDVPLGGGFWAPATVQVNIPLGAGDTAADPVIASPAETIPDAPPTALRAAPESALGHSPSTQLVTRDPLHAGPSIRSLNRRDDAVLWPPLALGISLIGPGVPQLIDRRQATGALLLGGFLGSVIGVGVLRERGPEQGTHLHRLSLTGTAGLAFLAFYLYSYSAIDAFYSHTQGGPGIPDLEERTIDIGLGLAPSLIDSNDDVFTMGVGGGLGVGLAPHPSVVVGLRDLLIFTSQSAENSDIVTIQLGPEIRLRHLFTPTLLASLSLGGIGQLHVETEEVTEPVAADHSTTRTSYRWGGYTYLGVGLHYFPARSWSLDFGLRGRVSFGEKRALNDALAPSRSFGVEYLGGLSWYL